VPGILKRPAQEEDHSSHSYKRRKHVEVEHDNNSEVCSRLLVSRGILNCLGAE
jgi:hypothetical protein